MSMDCQEMNVLPGSPVLPVLPVLPGSPVLLSGSGTLEERRIIPEVDLK